MFNMFFVREENYLRNICVLLLKGFRGYGMELKEKGN